MINRFEEKDLSKEFDLIVIGGGINGCGIARDASERKLKVLLLEKEDFGAGCTSVSTRLIHGGLRYLEHFEFDLVRESLVERELLLKNAKHLIHPLQICIPIYKGNKRPYWLIKIGMLLYDLLSFDKSLPSHKMMSADEFIKFEPSVKSENLLGAAVYYDTQASFPERICLENALMAKQNGAIILNHAQVVDINIASDQINNIDFLDLLSNKNFKVKGKIVVNASGPWVDSLCGLTKRHISQKIGGTKGSHIIIKQFDGGPKHALYTSAKQDGRPFFIIPWQGYYLIGTTDILYSENLDHIKASNEEINYLINEVNEILAKKVISREDIIFSYSGVRPLPHITNLDPGKITRRHIVVDHEHEGILNFISTVGGKLTTYRDLSEQVIDLVFKKLKYNFLSSKTKQIPLLGNMTSDFHDYKNQQLKKAQKKYDLDPEIVLHLINQYGTNYIKILDLTLLDKDLGRLLSSNTLDIRAQIIYAILKEQAFTVSDLLLRRTTLGLTEGFGLNSLSIITKQLQLLLNSSNEEVLKQVNEYERKVVNLRKI